MSEADSYGNFSANIDLLRRVGKPISGMDVVEIGAGNGNLVAHLMARGISVQGVETNPDRIQKARDTYGISLQMVEGARLPFQEGSQDVVLSFDVLEHIPNTQEHLAEVRRILRPRGSYVFATPNKVTNYPFEVIRNRSFSTHKAYHPSLFFKWQLKRELAAAGFDSVFHDVPIGVEFIEKKMEKFFGSVGKYVGKSIPFYALPRWARPNFYVHAIKKE